jgi:hypothetical protein
MYALGAMSLMGLWASWKNKSFSSVTCYCTIAFTLVVLFYAQGTRTTSGEIRHTEIRAKVLSRKLIINSNGGKDDD